MRLFVVVAIGVCCLGGGALAQPGGDAPASPAPPKPASPSYYNVLLDAVHASLRYPDNAVRSRVEGTCRVRVDFERDGTIRHLSLVKSGGARSLDAECVNVFVRTGKLPPVPDSLGGKEAAFTLDLPITFSLSDP